MWLVLFTALVLKKQKYTLLSLLVYTVVGKIISTREFIPKRGAPGWRTTGLQRSRREGEIRWVGVVMETFEKEVNYEYGMGRQKAFSVGCTRL